MSKKSNKSKSNLKNKFISFIEVVLIGILIDLFFAYQLGESFVIVNVIEPLTIGVYSLLSVKALMYILSGFIIGYFGRNLAIEFANTPLKVLLGMDEEQ